VSLRLGVVAFLVALVLGVSAGVVAALKQNSWIDYAVMGVAMIGVVLPNFVLAPLLALVFAVWLHWLPAGGWEGGGAMFMVLPVAVLCKHYISVIARIMRGSMIEVLGSPFIRTARAKGLPMHYILRRHALKPAMLPVISYLGPAFVGVITGSVVVETFFGIPGMGQLFINGALNRDYSMVLGLTILVGTLMITFNAIVDILYGFIDPRIRIK
jgi:oligopeptide transport system permease protein